MTETEQQDAIRAAIVTNLEEMVDEQWAQIWADFKSGQRGAEDAAKFKMRLAMGATFGQEGAGHRVKTTLRYAATRAVHIEQVLDGQPELPGVGGEGGTT